MTRIRNIKKFSEINGEQYEILKSIGYVGEENEFFPVINTKTGKCVAVIGDFGDIRSIKK